MNLILIGTNYKYSDIRTREKLSFSQNDIMLALSSLVDEGLAAGAVILSTCQRVEIYAQDSDAALLKRFFLHFKEAPASFVKYLYIMEGEDAVRHLFKVASGLDSQVIGEVEILGQVRRAYITAKSAEVATSLLNRLFERAIFTGRVVRRSAAISGRAPSIASAAVERCGRSGRLSGKNIFIIGTGAIAAKIAVAAAHRGAKCIVVAGRTFEKAGKLAARVGGKAIRFEEFYRLLNEADVIFSATSSRHVILKKEAFRQNRTSQKKLIIFDLAFPRDVDTTIAEIENVLLFDLDDLKEESLLKGREIAAANGLVSEKSRTFLEKEENRWRSGSVQGQALLR